MGSSCQADVVRKLIKIGCDPPGVPCECKTTGDVETHDIGQIVVYLRAERRGGKAVVRCVLILSDFGIRHSQCIDRSRTEQICAADRDRIGSVISIRPRTQDILLACRRSEEHTSELQSRLHLVCRLLLEKKKNNNTLYTSANSTEAVSNLPPK